MVAFPAFKLGALLIKQVSKPLANLAKARAKQSPFFRNYVCMPPAQFYHWCEVKLKMWSMNLGKPVNIPKLNEASAIELGAELVGEAFIFSIASGILIFEYVRQSRKESTKEAERAAQLELIINDLKTLYTEKAQQEAQIRELIRILEEKIPDSNFSPGPLDQSSIPKHHRGGATTAEHEEGGGAYNTVKSWVFHAIDYVLPPVNNTEPQKTNIIVIHHKPAASSSQDTDASCKCDDNKSPSGTGSNQPASSSIIKGLENANPKR